MHVTTDELRAAAELLLSHLENKGVTSITVCKDYYWDVPAAARYDRYQEPTKHTIGQLSDDMTELKRMMEGTRPPIGYGLVWLAAVRRLTVEGVWWTHSPPFGGRSARQGRAWLRSTAMSVYLPYECSSSLTHCVTF